MFFSTSRMAEMTLRETCKILGISRRALQGYEQAKLVSSSSKTQSGYLLYDDSARNRIKMIKCYQDMGFSLQEIKTIIDAPNTIKRPALIQRKEKLNEKILHNRKMIVIIEDMLKDL